MVLRSDGLYYSPIDLPQIAMQDRGLKPPEDVLACSRPLIERRPKPQNDQVMKCPRCDSLNTKFCYYNNYSLLQPRHFCKSCRRYWTKGGALRNVPVGGGCRKNKRTKQRTSEQSSSSHQSEPGSTSNTGGEGSSCNSLQESLSAGAGPGSLYYALPSGASVDGEDANLPYSRVQHQPVLRLADQTGLAASTADLFGIQGTSHLASLPPSTLASLSNHLSHLGALPLRNGFLGVDFSAAVRPEHGNLGVHGDLNPFLETHPHLAVSSAPTTNEGLTAFSLALDSFNTMDQPGHWKVHQQQKLALQTNHDGHIGQPRVVAPLENQPVEGLRHPQLRPGLTNLSPCRKVEDTRSADWQGQEGFFEASAEANYWNNGAWPEYSGYGPSASALLSRNGDGF